MVLTDEKNYQDIAAAIREKNGTEETYKPAEMAAAIAAIETGGGELPEEAYLITGDCKYRFAFDGWNWYIESFGNKIETKNISNGSYMFYNSANLSHISFELNFPQSTINISNMFEGCHKLEQIPKINNCKPSTTESLFENCQYMRYYPEDLEEWFDWSYIDGLATNYAGSTSGIFAYNYSLRKLPVEMLRHCNKYANGSYTSYYAMAQNCYALDELTNIPVLYRDVAKTNNMFSSSFSRLTRAKNITFETDNGVPYSATWKTQTLDISSDVGYNYVKGNFYNSGITENTKIKDAETYQALKDNINSYVANDSSYSRYNRTSAVNTINSLPDTSAYLATAGGTNTIKFKGVAGALTDGGAINTMTEEEIAVATAKGWTVSFV